MSRSLLNLPSEVASGSTVYARQLAACSRIRSSSEEVSTFFEGGLPWGGISEWGVPWGRGGREVVVSFLAGATQGLGLSTPMMCLWVYGPGSDVRVFPPAWEARGVRLASIRFVGSARPVEELKPLLSCSVFRLWVLDMPERLTMDDLSFLGRQARMESLTVMILRGVMLSPERGNVWARLRVNCWRDPWAPHKFRLKMVRGLSVKERSVDLWAPKLAIDF